MKNLYIQIQKEKTNWKNFWKQWIHPIEMRNVGNEKQLECEECLIEIPKWKKVDNLKKKINHLLEKDNFEQVLLTKEAEEYLGEEYLQKEKRTLLFRRGKTFLSETIEYILNKQGKKCENIDLYFLINEYSNETKEILEYYAKRFKVVNILSKNQKYYTRWIERMEAQEASNLVYNRNYRKGLAKAKIIINFDFTKDELKKFKINPDAIFISLQEKEMILEQIFHGLFIVETKMEANRERLGIYPELNQFSLEEIYTARIHPSTSILKVWEIVKKDGLKVKYLNGINGELDEKEYKSLQES